jgi:glutathione S-transferase
MHWERFAANKLADPLRCIFYHDLLQEPKTLIPILAQGGPWYGPLWLHLAYRKLNRRMREVYKINSHTAQLAMHVVDKAIKQLEKQLATNAFLVGDCFSRADLSVASLLSPLVLPERGYLKPEALRSSALLDYRKRYINSPVFRWVSTLYNTYR